MKFIIVLLNLLYFITSKQIQFNLQKNSITNAIPKSAWLEYTLNLTGGEVQDNHHQSLQLQQSSASLNIFESSMQIVSDIENYYNFQYLGNLWLGSSKSPFTFIFDTGSNELWFPTTDCKQCPAGFHRFDISKSQTYRRTSQKQEVIQYGKGKVIGYPSEEEVWFNEVDKINNMPCLAVTIQQDLYGTVADGIIGLAPLKIQNQPPYLLDLMKENGLINERIISFSYNDFGQESTLVFGQPNDSLIPQGATKISLPIEYRGILYFIQLKQITYGDTQLHFSNLPALIDTGTSIIAAPIYDVKMFLTYVITKYGNISTCHGGYIYCIECSKLNKNQDMIFDLEYGQQARIGFDELWKESSGDGMCDLMMIPIQNDMWILGDNFIRRYYTVIDYDRGVVELYDKTSQLQTSFQSNRIDFQNYQIQGLKLIEWIALLIISILIILTVVYMCKNLYYDRREAPYYSKIILHDDDISSNYAFLVENEGNYN